MPNLTVEQFKQELNQVDFFFEYCDDFYSYKQGSEQYWKVLTLTKENPIFKKLFDQKDPFCQVSNNKN